MLIFLINKNANDSYYHWFLIKSHLNYQCKWKYIMLQNNFNKPLLTVSILLALSSPTLANTEVDDTVVVIATKTNQGLEDVAASVTVINDEEIDSNLSNSIANIFDYTPGVSIENAGRQGIHSINVRGLSGNRVQILLDGVIQADAFNSGDQFINSTRLNFDPDILKSVEIVKGSASSLYGSNAIAGIASFSRKSASDFLNSAGDDFGGYTKLGYHSADNTFSKSITFANRTGNLESLISFSQKDGNEIDNFGKPNEENNSTNNLLLKFDYAVDDSNLIEVHASISQNKGEVFDIPSRHYNNYVGLDDTKTSIIGFGHTWSSNLSMLDNLEWNINWIRHEQNSDTYRTALSNGNKQHKDYVYRDNGIQFGVQADKYFSGDFIDHYFVYGLSYKTKNIHNQNDENNSIGVNKIFYYMPDAKEQSLGAFLQDDVTLFEGQLRLTPGIRFDSFKTDPNGNVAVGNPGGYTNESYSKYSDSSLTGRLGAVYEINDSHKVFAQISQGFRAPNFQELFYSWSNPLHGYKSIPNPDLKAETSLSYELGLRTDFTYSDLELSAFTNTYKNFIDRKVVASTPLQVNQYINLDTAKIYGIELSSKQNLSKILGLPAGLKSSISGVYTNGKNGEGEKLNSVNPWQAIAKLDYDSPDSNSGVSLKIAYTASKKTSSTPPFGINSATVVDITGYIKPFENLTFRAGVFNVTDKQHYQWNNVRSIGSKDLDKTQPERNFAVTAKYEF